jgi:hypothetical protein
MELTKKNFPTPCPEEKLSEQQLKEQLIAASLRHLEMAKKTMAPLLYWLRERLKKPGSRKGEGFQAWVDENLFITRRTADR